MQLAIFINKDIEFFFWKTVNIVENLEMTELAGGRGGSYVLWVIMVQCVRKPICDSHFTAKNFNSYYNCNMLRFLIMQFVLS